MALQQQRTPKQGRTQSRRRTPKQRQIATIEANQLRKAVFTLTPIQLEAHYQQRAAWQEEAADTETLSEHDSAETEGEAELDNRDPDEVMPDDEGQESFEANAPLEATDWEENSPALALNDLYRLCVVPGCDDCWSCHFERPGWMRRRVRSDPLSALIQGLDALAAWLQRDKQAFLRTPTAETFAQAPCGRLDEPAVLQNGLLATIRPATRQNDWAFPKEQDLSDLKDKVWLLWPSACLPLTALFSKEFKAAWVIARCAEQFPLARWCEDVDELSHDERRQALKMDPSTWTMKQVLACLCDKADQHPDAILTQLREQARCPHG